MAPEKSLTEIFVDSWLGKFLEIFEARAGVQISEQSTAAATIGAGIGESGLIGLEYPLEQSPGAVFWIGVTDTQAELIGRLLLKESDVAERQPQEALFELLQVSLEAAVAAVTDKFQLGGAQRPSQKTFDPEEAGSLAPVRFTGPEIDFEVYLGVSPQLQNLVTEKSASKCMESPPASGLDMLFDFELPVSFSFGRKKLALKDVLKLAPSSVVELDRAPDDLVEVIVNDSVIAWGEVVSIDGQYGIRIRRIASGGLRSSTLNTGAPARGLLRA